MSGLGALLAPRRPRSEAARRLPRAAGRVRKFRSERTAYLSLLPWIIGILGITIGPMIASLVLSFTDYNLLQDPNFIGWANYRQIFDDPNWIAAVKVTVIYVVVSVPLQLAVAL